MGICKYEFWTVNKLINNFTSGKIITGSNQRNKSLHSKQIKATIINTVLSPINDIQQITLTKKPNGKWSLDDGQQRTNNLCSFFNNEYGISHNSLPNNCKKDYWNNQLGTIKYEQLSDSMQSHFLNGVVPVKIIDSTLLEHMSSDYMFNALNTATVRLNGDEIIHGAYYGKYLNFIKSHFDNEYLTDIGFLKKSSVTRLGGIRPLITLSQQYLQKTFINSERSNIELVCATKRNLNLDERTMTSINDSIELVKDMFTVDEMSHLPLYCKPHFFNILVYIIDTLNTCAITYNKQDVKNALIKFHNNLNTVSADDEKDAKLKFKKLKIISLALETQKQKGSLSGICHKTNIAHYMFNYISYESDDTLKAVLLVDSQIPTLKMRATIK